MAEEGWKKLMCRLNRSFFWPSMRRVASLFIATCATCEKFRSFRGHPRSPCILFLKAIVGKC